MTDEVLQAMGGSFKGWEPRTYVGYFAERSRRLFGHRPVLTENLTKERSLMRGFLANWGTEAGPLMQHVFDRGGEYENRPVRLAHFSSPMKWLQDRWYEEMMRARSSEGSDWDSVLVSR